MRARLHTLPGGLRVVLEENRVAPVLSLQAMVTVGSADEEEREAGICHLMEHMLFKGTKNRKVGEIARDVEAAGGDINAYTSFDQTVYYINMAKRFADKGLEILADAVLNPTFDIEELEREKEVILEEIRRERDNPGRHVGEILFQKAFRQHTYGRPVIGFEKTVKETSQEDLFVFHRRWYTPQNTVFVAVGDFAEAEMLKKIESAFEGFKNLNWTPPTTPRVTEPAQETPVTEIVPDNIQSVHFELGYHVPRITHPDIPALDILSLVLGGSESSRLEQILKEKKRLVQSIHAAAYTPKDPGLMILGGCLNADQLPRALPILFEEVERLKNEGPTAEEIKRAKLNIRATQTYERETVGGQAGKIAYFLATAGKIEFEEDYYQRLQHVSIEEVAGVASQYLSHAGKTAVILAPKKDCIKKWEEEVRKILGEEPPRAKKRKHPAAEGPEEVECVPLPGGLRLLLKEDHSLPIVALCATSLGGLLAETQANNGIHQLMAQCLTKGTKRKNALEIAKAAESIAGSLEGFSGKNSIGLRSEFLSDYLKDGCELFLETLLQPSWNPGEVAKEKKLILEAIKNQEDNLSSLAFYHFQKALYPAHPYGMRALGTRKSVPGLTPAHLKNAYFKLLTTKNLVLSAVGDFSALKLAALFREALKNLPRKEAPFKMLKPDPKPEAIRKVSVPKEKAQAHIVLGFSATTLASKDHLPLLVMNNILSGMGGRLFLELRDKMSLAYTVTSILQNGVAPGFLACYIGTEPSKVPTALKAMKKELEKISREPVTPEELERTKNYLVGTYELDLQKNSSQAQAYAFNELYGLSYKEVDRYPEKILRVTREDILNVAKKYIDLDAYVLATVSPSP